MAFDDIKDKNSMSQSRGTELLKRRTETMQRQSVQEIRILERIAQEQAELDKISSTVVSGLSKEEFDKRFQVLTQAARQIQSLKDAYSVLEKGRMHGAVKQFEVGLRTTLSTTATTTDIASAARSSANLGSAVNMAQTRGTTELEESIERGKRLIYRQTERIRETGHSIEGNEGRFSSQLNVRERLVQQVGLEQAALAAQKKMGLDSPSQYYRATDIAEQVRKDQERNQIRSDVSAGSYGSRRQVEEQLNETAKKLLTSFEALDDAVRAGSEEIPHLTREFGSLEKEYKKQKDVLGEITRSGVGGPGGGLGAAMGILGSIGTVVQGMGQAYRYVGVTSEVTQAQNRIGFANLANQRFSDAYGATQGDMSALRRVMSDQYGEQVRRGLLMSGREDTAKLMETAGSGARALGTVVGELADPMHSGMAAVKGFFKGGPSGAVSGALSQIPEALAKATPDAVAFTQNLADYTKMNTQGQTFLQSAQQMRQLQDAVAQISDFSSQAAFDYTKGTTFATRGLGIGGSPIMPSYYAGTTMRGDGRLGTQTTGMLSTDGGDLREYIKHKESLGLKAYGDTSKGFSIGYGHFVAGTGLKGTSISRDQAEAMLDQDINAHAGAVNNMLGPEIMGKLSPGQKNALYDLAYNAGAGALNYGRKGQSIASRLRRGDMAGAGQQILRTATTADGVVNENLVGRRQEENGMWNNVSTTTASSIAGRGMLSQGIRGGGDRENLQSLLTDPAVVGMLANAGISTKDLPKLVGMGVGGLGKEFGREGGMGGINDLQRAGQLSRVGYMQSPEQYFQARSMMTGQGGDQQNLEEILKSAVANGMDSSKNIMEMVQATSTIAQHSAQMGINAFGGASELMGRSIDALRGGGMSANMAVAAAAGAANFSEGAGKSTDLTLANVVEVARIRRMFPRANLMQMTAMQRATPSQLTQLQQLYSTHQDQRAEEMSVRMGLYGVVTNADQAKSLMQAKEEKVVTSLTGYGIDEKMRKSIIAKGGKGLTPEERSFANAAGLAFGVSGEGVTGYVGTGATARKGTLANAPGGAVAGGEDIMRGGATADARVFADGVKNFDAAIGGLKAVGDTMMNVAKAIDPHQYAQSVKEAAADFKIPAGQFGDAVDDFQTAVGDLADAIGKIFGNSGPNLKNNVNPAQTRGK